MEMKEYEFEEYQEERRLWTKEEIRQLIEMWDSKRPREIAEEMGRDVSAIYYMAGLLRKEGVPISNKRKVGSINNLVKEVVKELYHE